MFDRIVKTKRTKLFFLETILLLGILTGINIIFWPHNPAFEGFSPNPLWAVVLLISARYGRYGALFAGLMTALQFIGYYVFIYGIEAFYEDLWLLRFPFLFILIAFLIGEIKTVFILREDYLTSRVQELENQNEKITNENDIIKEAHKDLSINVATNQDTITILNEITARLKSLIPKDIYKGMLESFRDYLEAEECSYYSQEGNLLVLKDKIGWKDYYRRPESYEIGKGLIGLSAEKQETYSIKDIVLKKKTEASNLDMVGDSVLTVPVIGLDNKLYGVASIEKIPLLKLTDSTIQAARITCELAASSLNNAYAFKSMEDQQIKEKDTDLYKYHFFIKRLEEEYLRSLNYMLPLSIMAFKWPSLHNPEDQKKIATLKTITELIQNNLRAFDVLAKGPIKETPLLLMLATTPGPQAEAFKNKIIDKIKEYDLDKVVTNDNIRDSVIVADFNPNKVHSAQDMLKLIGL